MIGWWPFSPLVVFLTMTVRNGGVSMHRFGYWFGYVLRFIILEPVRVLERWRYERAIRNHTLAAPPIFILGHWRSGTSYLQTLLSLDPMCTTPTIYRSLFSDVFLLTERWLKPILNRLARTFGVRYAIQRRALDFDLPAEADLGICCLCSPYSYTWGHVFPTRFGQWMRRCVYAPSDEVVSGWLAAYDYFIRKVSLASKGKRVVLKSPGDTARLTHLATRFPEARFIYIHRDATEVFHSNRYLWQVIESDHGVQRCSQTAVDSQILEHYATLLAEYRSQRETIAARRLMEIDYSALRQDPVSILSDVYAQLELGPAPVAALRAFLLAQAEYSPQEYQTSPALAETLRQSWGESRPSR